jgi:hypothetical protein
MEELREIHISSGVSRRSRSHRLPVHDRLQKAYEQIVRRSKPNQFMTSQPYKGPALPQTGLCAP